VKWVIPNVLARAQRPGYRGELRKHVAEGDVAEWVNDAQKEGVRSIICLLAPDELAFYDSNLLAYYRKCGFLVEHIPVEDYQRPPMTSAQLESVLDAFRRCTKPVLIHCSAGFGRSRMAINYVETFLGTT
jgi:protein tyrosine phosphatase (PTP) superfamily phosphohydrolase (DUF442 family)